MSICIVCSFTLSKERDVSGESSDGKRYQTYDCPRCGHFWWDVDMLGHAPLIDLKDDKTRAALSHYIRVNQGDARVKINRDNATEVLRKCQLPTPSQQANNLLRWLQAEQAGRPNYVKLVSSEIAARIGTMDLGPDATFKDLKYVIGALRDKKLIEIEIEDLRDKPDGNYRLTIEGYDEIDKKK